LEIAAVCVTLDRALMAFFADGYEIGRVEEQGKVALVVSPVVGNRRIWCFASSRSTRAPPSVTTSTAAETGRVATSAATLNNFWNIVWASRLSDAAAAI
jgi:hypothetical protein